MEMLKLFLSFMIACSLAQLLKVGLRYYELKKFELRDLIRTGGMPSSHSALVVALTLSVYIIQGFSATFFVSLVVLFVVLRDAVGVRRTVGEEGKLLLKISDKLKIKAKDIPISMGHTPLQVLIGMSIGAIVTLIIFFVF